MLKLLVLFPSMSLLLVANPNLHPRLSNGEKTIKRVVVLPVTTDYSKLGVRAKERDQKAAAELQVEMERVLKAALEKREFAVVSPDAASGAGGAEAAAVQSWYDEVSSRIESGRDIERGLFTLGDRVSKAPLAGEVDAIVFMRADGAHNTKKRRLAMGGLAGLYVFSDKTVRPMVSFVDATNGDILFHISPKGIVRAKMDKYLADCLKKVPGATK